MHTVVGAVVALGSVITPVVAVSLLASWVQGRDRILVGSTEIEVPQAWAPVLALALVLALGCAVAAAGASAAWAAPALLGPDAATRLAALERRTSELVERNRLARELHDSIGHALTVTTLQAGAARTVLHSDVDFVEQALTAIETTGRLAAADLDRFLGLLREESDEVRMPSLGDVGSLVSSHRKAGLPVTLRVEGDLDAVPAIASREVFRIIQEGLTNVQRHAGSVPTDVFVTFADRRLTAQVSNKVGSDANLRQAANGGGHGLAGVRERVRLLGGQVEAGPAHDSWRLQVVVPTGDRGGRGDQVPT